MTGSVQRQPLAVRLALLLSGVVLVVLLVAGIAVNQVVSRSIEAELAAARHGRLAFAATALDEPGRPRRAAHMLHAIAEQTGGHVVLRDADGRVVGEAGHPVDGPSERIEQPAGERTLEVEVPAASPPILRIFNAALIVGGAVSVAVIVVLALGVGARLTRPLRALTAAAGRLGAGELNVRAGGGPDRESAELAEAFNAMADRLERSERLRRRAASDMAHDLATPATLLESQLQAMIDGLVPADRGGLERARSAAAALNGVIVQLGELIDAESAALARRVERVSIGQLAREAISSLAPLADARGVEVIAPVGDVTAMVDAGQIGRALRNVLTNAVQHTPSGGEVRLRADADAGTVRVRVVDGGPGIAAADLPHVFERFYRADPSRSRGGEPGSGGSGIGLTIARDLVVANGGALAIERTGPGGTTVLMTLPSG